MDLMYTLKVMFSVADIHTGLNVHTEGHVFCC